jgi:drug/metabolite transporter (DMT)-like permease
MASDNSPADRLAADTRVQHAQRFPVLVGLFLFVILAWGLNWVVMKVVVREVTPIWAVAFRTWIAAVVLIPTVALSRQLIVPHRNDLPIIGVISLVHMVAFAALMTAGLKFLPVGRAVVLGYTTPSLGGACSFGFFERSYEPETDCGHRDWSRGLAVAI